MTDALALASTPLLVELHAALTELDRRMRRSRFTELATRIETVRTRLTALSNDSEGELAARIDALANALTPPPEEARRGPWLAYRARVQPHFEAVVHDLRAERVDVPSLRPTNYARNALHVTSAVVGLALLELASDAVVPIVVALGFALAGWSLELGRRKSEAVNAFCMRLFGKTAHPHEAHRVNSATWYATSLALIALAQDVAAAAIALLVLGFGDPAAAIIGRRFGRTQLMHGRTLEGTLAFVVVGAAVSVGFLAAVHPSIDLLHVLLGALAGASAGACAELSSRRLDDNLTIPLAAFVFAVPFV